MTKWRSDEELRTLADGPEGELVEWKNGFDDMGSRGLRKSVCAFANDLHGHNKPGVIFVGIRDDGSLSGAEISDGLMRNLADIRDDPRFSAPLRLRPRPLSLKGGEVAALQVMPFPSPPVRYAREVYVRIGPTNSKANEADLQALNDRRRQRDVCPDIRPVEKAGLSDLNLAYFREEFMPAWLPPEDLAQNDRSQEQRLGDAKMISGVDDPTPTTLGLLVLGRDPLKFLSGAYVQFLRIDGDELGENIADDERFSGTVAEIVRDAEKKMRACNQVAVKYVTVPREQRQWLYPPAALEQIFRNAILHRNYEAATRPVDVRWYDNRVEIISPGGPYGIAPRADFPRPGQRAYRNPNLAEAMKTLGLVQRFGTGVSQARRAMKENGNPPLEFIVDQHTVICTLRPAIPGREFRLSPKTVVSLAQFLHLFGNPGYQLLGKHGIVRRAGGGGIETMLERAEPEQLRGLLDEIGRTKMALQRQMVAWEVEKERRDLGDEDPVSYKARLAEGRETAKAAFAERFEDLEFCLREDGFRFREEGESAGSGVIPV